jgi:Fe-S-cluster containining protein
LFSVTVIDDLLENTQVLRKELGEAYDTLPSTMCKRKTECCSLMPEITILEALDAIQNLIAMPNNMRLLMYKKIVRYFMTNPVEVTKCPFLEGEECLIYRNRFFGCRAYGLWSKEYYENLSERSRHMKIHIREAWEKMDVHLPKEIIEFQVPYCTDVMPTGKTAIHDDLILSVAETVENLSRQCARWHYIFKETYFSDLSFFLTSLFFGFNDAILLKFNVVSDILKNENRESLDDILDKIPDIFQGI